MHTGTNGETWAPLHTARVKPATATNVFRVKAGVHLAIGVEQVLAPTSAGSYSLTETCQEPSKLTETGKQGKPIQISHQRWSS